MVDDDLETWARNTGALLSQRGLRLATAESCTGGLIVAMLTAIPGSSDWLECGFVTYSVEAKQQMLGVRPETLEHHGAVSEPTAREMALGALIHSTADVAVSVTGIAGPGGGEILQPVGTVWFGWALRTADDVIFESAVHTFRGTRAEVRENAVRTALIGIKSILDKSI
jgi:nicotinamide-nucleotide amidase